MHVLLWVAVNALFADPLVQRAAVDDATFSSALWHPSRSAASLPCCRSHWRSRLAWSLADDRLVTMSALLALPLPLVGAAGPVQGLLTSNRAYEALAWRTLIGQGLGTLTGIVAALAGAGAWALVLQQVVISGAGALALLAAVPDADRAASSAGNDLREMLRIGLPLTASTLVQHGRYRLFALLIGGTAGAAALGQVHMAFRLVDTVRELAFTAQWRLMLPLLSERQNDLPALRASMDRCLAWSSLLAFPLCAAMALSIQPLVAAAARSGLAAVRRRGIAADRADRLAVPGVSRRRRRHRARRAALHADRQHRRHCRDRGRRHAAPPGLAAAGGAGVARRTGLRQPVRAAGQRACAGHHARCGRYAPACRCSPHRCSQRLPHLPCRMRWRSRNRRYR